MFFKLFKSNVIVATAYFIFGHVGLLLAVPPINAAAIWPAAGIALAAVLISGNKILPGILIGTALVEMAAYLDTTNITAIFSSLFIIFSLSVAVTFQAWFGATLIKRYIKNDKALLKERSAFLFCLLAGPISCSITATVSIVVLSLKGLLALIDMPLSWMTWWIGDSIGVIVVSPIILCLFAEPRYFWKQRIISVALPLCVVISILFIAFRFSYQQEMQFIENEFEKNAKYFTEELQDSIDSNVEATYELKEFFDNSLVVSPQEFIRYTQPKLKRHPEIKALEWTPKVLHKDRVIFESQVGASIKMLNENRQLEVSDEKEFYYAIKYVEPLKGNENALGFDIRNNKDASMAAEEACSSGEVSVTDTIQLVQEPNLEFGIVFYAAVYEKINSHESVANCDALAGFVASVFRLEDEIYSILKRMSYLNLSVSLKEEGKVFFSNLSNKENKHVLTNQIKFYQIYPISVANRQWQLVFSPADGFYSLYSSWSIWLVLVGGLFLAGLSGMGLLMLTGRSLLTEDKVKQRTRELNNEIKERENVAYFLEIENKFLELMTKDFSIDELLDSINLGIEKLVPGSLSSILLLDKEARFLSEGSAPSLPVEYSKAILGVEIGPKVGSCGTAAYFNKQIIVNDIEHDELWKDYKDLALKHGLKACWSTPITIDDEKVIGTFAIYFPTVMKDDKKTIELLSRVSKIVAIAILRKKTEEQLTFHANHDALTGLVNRHKFERRTKKLLSSVKEGQEEHALCFMDLDQFKVVNDSCGHVAGDELLRQLTTVLKSVIRKRDTLARLGGDEFGALMENCSLEDAHRVATSLQKAVQDYQFIWENHSFKVSASIGLVPITSSSGTITQLLSDADAACYIAKDSGRNRIHVYHPEDSEVATRHGEMQWVSRINRALQDDRFCLYAQTIESLDINNQKHRHYELLIRMLEEDDKTIPPGAFLPAAERYNMITKIDHWVIKHVFELLADNPEFLKQIDFCSINLSGESLSDPDMLNYIIEQLNETEIGGYKICFEITETAAISNLNKATEFISTLKGMGCRFALDDFGSGLSSFGYLKNLSVDYLKIDGMFVKDIAVDPIDHAMVKSINEIGSVMGMQTIAEFVENDVIKGMLKEIGVNYVQGYGIGKPQPLNDLLKKKSLLID
jgi:diguanylate cyclase (GGDEF)-like protein